MGEGNTADWEWGQGGEKGGRGSYEKKKFEEEVMKEKKEEEEVMKEEKEDSEEKVENVKEVAPRAS